MSSTRSVISASNVTKVYDTDEPVTALEDVSMEVSQGEFVSIIGPSGCGKSTLLRMVAGLVSPTAGSIEIEGRPVDQSTTRVGIVFQNPVLLPWRRILDNVLLPIDAMQLGRADYLERARELLKLTGLADFEKRYPSELSGGMQQRVAICRALIHDPPILLMDEPFGSLDALTRDTMGLELLKIWEARRRTIVFVTHSVPEAMFLSDKVVVMSARPGRVVSVIETRLPRPRRFALRGGAEFGQLVKDAFAKLGFADTYG